MYLQPDVQEKILSEFSNQGHMLLSNFLLSEKFETLKKESDSIQWEHQGPLNIKNYYRGANLPPVCREFQTLLSLIQFKDFLNILTGMDSRISLNESCRQFKFGNYKLLRDDQLEVCGIDLEYYLTTSSACTTYCTMDCELISIEPQSNSLSLVYRDEGVMRCVNCNTGHGRIDFVGTYNEISPEDSDMEE
eukprot:NODE_1037_length_2504_cov_0.688565.p2 type:complete len:191 gc:universal NODE_1037_length_2504_cov_0.688565:1-573(+)